MDGRAISEVSLFKDGTFKFKLHDKLKALELLGKHLGMFNDTVRLTGDMGVQIIDDISKDTDPAD